jgi:hypothetical protein
MSYKLASAGAVIAGAVIIGSSVASADIIDLTPPNTPFFGPKLPTKYCPQYWSGYLADQRE